MNNGQQDQDSKARITELEQEVQRLKAQVEPEPVADDGAPITEADMPYMPPRWRAIVIPIAIGIIVFVGILAVTSALSSGFDAFARKAASSIVPDDVAEQAGQPASGQRPAVKVAPMNPGGSAEPPIRAPGL